MSSFTTPPIVKMYDINRWELFTPYTYRRKPILDDKGNEKLPEQYTYEEKKYRTLENIRTFE